MDLTNNSTIETVIEFANVKFGMEISRDELVEQLKNLSFSETLKLINSMKADNNDAFAEIIDLSALSETEDIAKAHTLKHTLPQIDTEKYQERDGLEGPIATRSGKVVYYDPIEGKYYDPDSDMYIEYDDMRVLTREANINEWVILPWLLPALATAARVGGPALIRILKHGKNAAGKAKVPAGNAATSILKNPGTTLSWVGGGYVFKSVYDVVEKVKEAVGDFMDDISIEKFAEIVWKHKLPVAAVIAVLYGGKKLKDYMAGEEEETGNTTINNYYGEPATEDTNRLKKLAGIKEAPADVYSTETPHGAKLQDSTMHGLMDKIEDYYHAETGDDMMDVQIGDDDVYIGNDHFSIYKNGEDLSYDLPTELEKEDISIGRGPYQHKLSGDDLERSKTLTPDQIKVLAKVESKETVSEHDMGLLRNVARQMEADAHAGDYTAIEELLHNVSKEELEAFLSDHRSPDWTEESVKEYVQEPNPGQEDKFTGQEINFIHELCLRHDGVERDPAGLKYLGKSELWDGGNIIYDKVALAKLMLWVKKNKDDVEKRFSRMFKNYSNKDENGKVTASDGNQILLNINSKIGTGEVEELDEYGTAHTANPSRATIRSDKTNYKVSGRRANNIAQDQNRDSSVPNRTVAGGNKQPTGTGAVRSGSADPDDIERANNANVSAQNQEQANINAQEIERLKQLAMGG